MFKMSSIFQKEHRYQINKEAELNALVDDKINERVYVSFLLENHTRLETDQPETSKLLTAEML